MSSETLHNKEAFYTALVGITLSDPESLLFGWAQADLCPDEESREVAEMLKERAIELGVTEEQFKVARENMEFVNQLLQDSN